MIVSSGGLAQADIVSIIDPIGGQEIDNEIGTLSEAAFEALLMTEAEISYGRYFDLVNTRELSSSFIIRRLREGLSKEGPDKLPWLLYLVKLGRNPKLIPDVEVALARYPEDPRVVLRAAEVLLKLGNEKAKFPIPALLRLLSDPTHRRGPGRVAPRRGDGGRLDDGR